ncbi:unnamed protein product [Allacma fusca]|uniref:Uncharacterized protein n=1 Tax=Allacma fusca TaxID=39272 RepID=A0A8J2P5T7_9HEXA|nr:unnamed protein product [Allacma fusca]
MQKQSDSKRIRVPLPPRKVSLAGYKLAFVRPAVGGVILTGIVTRQNAHLNDEGYFVVGGDNVDNEQMRWPNSNVKMVKTSTPQTPNVFSIFGYKGKNFPADISLLKTKAGNAKYDLSSLNLGTAKKEKPIVKAILKAHVVDAVV